MNKQFKYVHFISGPIHLDLIRYLKIFGLSLDSFFWIQSIIQTPVKYK